MISPPPHICGRPPQQCVWPLSAASPGSPFSPRLSMLCSLWPSFLWMTRGTVSQSVSQQLHCTYMCDSIQSSHSVANCNYIKLMNVYEVCLLCPHSAMNGDSCDARKWSCCFHGLVNAERCQWNTPTSGASHSTQQEGLWKVSVKSRYNVLLSLTTSEVINRQQEMSSNH